MPNAGEISLQRMCSAPQAKRKTRAGLNLDFMKLGVLTASDASFAGERDLKSQQGRIHFLAPAEQLIDRDNCAYDILLVSYSSTTIKRVCRATLQAETYEL